MKKISLLILILAMFLFSCGTTEEIEPTVQIPTDTEIVLVPAYTLMPTETPQPILPTDTQVVKNYDPILTRVDDLVFFVWN